MKWLWRSLFYCLYLFLSRCVSFLSLSHLPDHSLGCSTIECLEYRDEKHVKQCHQQEIVNTLYCCLFLDTTKITPQQWQQHHLIDISSINTRARPRFSWLSFHFDPLVIRMWRVCQYEKDVYVIRTHIVYKSLNVKIPFIGHTMICSCSLFHSLFASALAKY